MAGKTSKNSASAAEKAAARRVAAKAAKPRKAVATSSAGTTTKPILLAGGNPQIAKADGDAPLQAYIAAMPGWKRDVGRRLDALIVRTVPGVRKAVKWNSPVLRSRGPGLVPRLPLLDQIRQGGIHPRHVTTSSPSRRVQGQGHPLPRHLRGRGDRREPRGELDSAGIGATRLGPLAGAPRLRALRRTRGILAIPQAAYARCLSLSGFLTT